MPMNWSASHKPRVRRRQSLQFWRFVLGVIDPRSWLHLFKIVNYWSYSHVRPRRKMLAGRNLGLAPTVHLANAHHIQLGNDVIVNTGAMLWGGAKSGRITVGDRVLIGPNVLLTASNYDISKHDEPMMLRDPIERDVSIGDDVWIGAGAIILPGVSVGEGAIVGAGAVVSCDVLPFDIVTGIRANRRGSRM